MLPKKIIKEILALIEPIVNDLKDRKLRFYLKILLNVIEGIVDENELLKKQAKRAETDGEPEQGS